MHDSSRCAICRGKPAGNSLSDRDFATFVDSCRAESAAKQRDFEAAIRFATRWSYDMADQRLTIGDVTYGMTPIGTYSPDYTSWLWAWANDDFPTATRKASSAIQVLHAITGFQVFMNPGIGASADDVDDFVALAVHALDARGFFRCPSDGGPTLFLAVHDPQPNDN